MGEIYRRIRWPLGCRARRFGLLSGMSAAVVMVLLSSAPASRAAIINVVDVIPTSDSSEAFQNSEPSLGVNPLNPLQMIAGSFGNGTPYFKSINGGTIWSDYGTLNTNDKSIAWRQDGVAALTTTLQVISNPPPSFSDPNLPGIDRGGQFWGADQHIQSESRTRPAMDQNRPLWSDLRDVQQFEQYRRQNCSDQSVVE